MLHVPLNCDYFSRDLEILSRKRDRYMSQHDLVDKVRWFPTQERRFGGTKGYIRDIKNLDENPSLWYQLTCDKHEVFACQHVINFPYRWWKKSGKPIDRYSRSSHDLRPFFTSQVVTTRLRAQIGPSSDIKVGLSPFPGCQSPPGWHYMFRCGDSYLNLHLLLLLRGGTIYAPYGCFLQPLIYMYDAGYQ